MLYSKHMDVTTAQLYDLLTDNGFEKPRVREALADVVSKEELTLKLGSFEERIDRKFAEQTSKFSQTLLVHSLGIIAANLAGTALILQFFQS